MLSLKYTRGEHFSSYQPRNLASACLRLACLSQACTSTDLVVAGQTGHLTVTLENLKSNVGLRRVQSNEDTHCRLVSADGADTVSVLLLLGAGFGAAER